MSRLLSALILASVATVSAEPVAGLHRESSNQRQDLSDQASSGGQVYGERCAGCHGAELEGADRNPSLKGDVFIDRWVGSDLAAFVERLRTMPADAPGSLTASQYAGLAAFLLNMNRAAINAGGVPEDIAMQRTLSIKKVP
jgi:polar amino acid transport system substrate-binding protein